MMSKKLKTFRWIDFFGVSIGYLKFEGGMRFSVSKLISFITFYIFSYVIFLCWGGSIEWSYALILPLFMLSTVMLHELGHYIAAKLVGLKINEALISTVLGSLIYFPSHVMKHYSDVIAVSLFDRFSGDRHGGYVSVSWGHLGSRYEQIRALFLSTLAGPVVNLVLMLSCFGIHLLFDELLIFLFGIVNMFIFIMSLSTDGVLMWKLWRNPDEILSS